jgi:hypothetical protein
MFNRVKHYIGTSFYGKNIKVSVLNKNTGDIYEIDEEGKRRLAYLFNIFDKDHAKETSKGLFYAGPERTQVRPFNSEEYTSKKQEDETDEEYETRVTFAIQAISVLPRLLHNLSLENVSLQNRNIKEQVIIAEAAAVFAEDKEKYARFLVFVKKFQNSFDVFNAIFYGHEYAERLLDLSERLPRQEDILREGFFLTRKSPKIFEKKRKSPLFAEEKILSMFFLKPQKVHRYKPKLSEKEK